jgi:hypothetical protein
MTVRHLDGGAVSSTNDLGSFKENDQCLGTAAANYIHNYTKKQNISIRGGTVSKYYGLKMVV